MLERLPDRSRPLSLARAVMSPSAILLGGAGTAAAIVAGAPVVAAGIIGALAWAGRVLFLMPRTRRRPDMNPALIKEPWRSLVRQALEAEKRFRETVAGTRRGPLRDRLAEVGERVSVAVDEAWGIAKRGDSLDAAVRDLDTDKIARDLAAHEAELGRDPARADLEATVNALRRQQAAASRVADVAGSSLSRLRVMVAHLNEAVARAVELSLTPTDVGAVQPLTQDVDGLVHDLEALRQAMAEVTGEAV